MRSRGDPVRHPGEDDASPGRARIVAEWALRAVTLAALGTLLWRWTHPTPASAAVPELVTVRTDPTSLGAALRRWTDAPAPAGHLALDGLPDAPTRDWVRALRAAGMRVTWSAERMPALAASAASLADPAGGVRVEVSGAAAAVGDAFAAVDTVRAASGEAVVLPAAGETLVARAAGASARLARPAAPRLGAVLVLGRAGWEAKFVAAALEERGWPVRVRVAVAPGVTVTQGAGATAPPDTATTAAVVVLDSGVVDAAEAARLARYVRAGGGLVLAGEAASTPALRPLAAGPSGAPSLGAPGAIDGPAPKRGLMLLPVEPPRPDAVVLERRDGSASGPVAVAARRIGAGRVVQTGYVETWRWRMATGDDAPAAHRAWWARVVGASAYLPYTPPREIASDPAPLAATLATLGTSSAPPRPARSGIPSGRWPSDSWLATIAAAALLGEVASRRTRGQR